MQPQRIYVYAPGARPGLSPQQMRLWHFIKAHRTFPTIRAIAAYMRWSEEFTQAELSVLRGAGYLKKILNPHRDERYVWEIQ